MNKSGKLEKFLMAGGVLLCVLIISVIMILLNRSKEDETDCITRAEAARMISLAQVSMSTVSSTDMEDNFDGSEEWYCKYMNYMYFKGDFNKKDENNPLDKLNYSDIKHILSNRQIEVAEVEKMSGLDITDKNGREKVKREDFILIYDAIIPYLDIERIASYENITVCGKPDENMLAASEGVYKADGIDGSKYADKEVNAFIKDDEIVYIREVVSDEITYKNAYISECTSEKIVIFLKGVYREYNVDLEEPFNSQTVGDIFITAGQINEIHLKEDKISGKVLSVNDEYIEVEKYGKVPLDEGFNVYRSYGSLGAMKKSDILVGYDLQEFVVADGKICAAVIYKTMTASNIRVLIMTTGFESVFHDNVQITSASGFTLMYGEQSEHFDAGSILNLEKATPYFEQGRLTIVPDADDEDGRLTINTVNRSQGIPSYRGNIEIAVEENGLTIVNDLPLEEYLYAVVPSEMPVKYGLEAQKVQAVCARSYAYRQLLNNAYSRYGAHVDDSVSFQVYNNISEQEVSIQAVNETYGETACYGDDVVETFYYSTSCGYSTDCAIWGSDPAGYPYLDGHTINEERAVMDLTSEEAFRQFINSEDTNCFDCGFGFYRWSAEIPFTVLNSKIPKEIGKITNISITERINGGIGSVLTVTGELGTHTINGEYNIRKFLGDKSINVITKDQTTYNAALLPSAFIYIDPVYDENGAASGISVHGGGYGHGVGMSQNAVPAMVESGMNYHDILKFFYKDIEIKSVY